MAVVCLAAGALEHPRGGPWETSYQAEDPATLLAVVTSPTKLREAK